MGKHDGVVERQHVWIRVIGLGLLLLAGVASLWWWSLRTPADPIEANPVAAQAFVVSSQPCTDRGAGTVIELMPASGGQVRAVVNGCGFTDGQQLAVEYLAGDPSQVRLAGSNAPSGTDTVRQWWPIGLGVVAVLAAGLAVVLVVDGRRFRSGPGSPPPFRDASSAPAAGEDPTARLTAMLSTSADRGVPSVTAVTGAAPHRGGRHARRELDDDQADDQLDDDQLDEGRLDNSEPAADGWLRSADQDGWLLEPAQAWSAELSIAGDGQRSLGESDAANFRLDLVFPSTAELAASLHDELFTHRHAQVSGG